MTLGDNLEHDLVISRREALKTGGVAVVAALSATFASVLGSSTKGLVEDVLADDKKKREDAEDVELPYKMRGNSVLISLKTTEGKIKECAGIRFDNYCYVTPKDVLSDSKYVRDITGTRIFRKKNQHELREFKAVTFYDQKNGYAYPVFAVTHPEIDFAILVPGGRLVDRETIEEERREEKLLEANYGNYADKKLVGKSVTTLAYPSVSFLRKTGKITQVIDTKRIAMEQGSGWKNGAITSHQLKAYFGNSEGMGVLQGSLAITDDQTVCIITNIEQVGNSYVATFVPVGSRSLGYLFDVALPLIDTEKRGFPNPISDKCAVQILEKSSIDADKEREKEDE